MNVLEHFIKEIHSVRDITEEFEQHSGREPAEPLLQVDLTYDCYGIITREMGVHIATLITSAWLQIRKSS